MKLEWAQKNQMLTYKAPVLHGPALKIRDGDTVVLGQRVAHAEVVLVVRDGPLAHVQSKKTLEKNKDEAI